MMRLYLRRLAWLSVAAIVLSALALSLAIEWLDIPPRALGPYIERRGSGHNPAIVWFGNSMNAILTRLDRAGYMPPDPARLRPGGPLSSIAAPAAGRMVPVNSVDGIKQAMARAAPGDVITLSPGTYRFRGRAIEASQAGSKAGPITVRAEQAGSVLLEFTMREGFRVSAPHWVFENLEIRGTCDSHAACEHAFHVVGKASNFIARGNIITDFNSHFKINGEGGAFPDHGVIESNKLTNTAVRKTSNPVTLIDLVGASNWIVRHNLIADFIKGEGNRISYGGFAKGAGFGNRFERNIVLCEYRLRGVAGQRVGLSLGGGGTGRAYCRDKRCITEQDDGVIDSNLIASCSDVGVYLNRAARSSISHNTLIDTAGIQLRFPESSADVEGNLVDGVIRTSQDAILRAEDNYTTSMLRIYLGSHPVRALYRDGSELSGWEGNPPRRAVAGAQRRDLCGNQRPQNPAYGAFENFNACLLGD